MRPAAGERLAEQLHVRGDAVVGGVVPAEGLGEVEDQVGVDACQGVQALHRAVEHVQRGVVPEPAERFGDFVFDFLLVERARQRDLVTRRGRGIIRFVPAIVKNKNVQFAHKCG
jgi:hypothetical protein